MPVNHVGFSTGPHGQAFLIRTEPRWTAAVVTIVDKLCSLTGHRMCMSALMMWSLDLSDRHTDEFVIPTSRQTLRDYCLWRGDWAVVLFEDDDPADYREGSPQA